MSERHVFIHDRDCRCRRCNPPATAGEIVGGLIVTALIAAVLLKGSEE